MEDGEHEVDAVDHEDETVRRVQRTGATSLSVTLPKSWTAAMNVQSQDRLRFRDLGGGRLELSLVGGHGSPAPREQRTLRLDTRGAPPQLLGRLVIGGFITGQDRVELLGSLSPLQREEVGKAVERLLGTSIVEERPDRLDIQNFLDPTRYPIPKLLSRMAGLLRAQVELCAQALEAPSKEELARIDSVEDELDRVYLILVRQLLISSDDFRVAKEIGVASHHFQLGYRVVAKSLEVVGDLLYETGRDLAEIGQAADRLPKPVRAELHQLVSQFGLALDRALSAFMGVSVVEANEGLNRARTDLPLLHEAGPRLSRKIKDLTVSLLVQRAVTSLAHAQEMLGVVNEITLNKAVEPEVLSRTPGQPLRVASPSQS